MRREQAASVLRLLLSDSKSLRELAEMTHLDPFGFYQGADLTAIDLSDQDLTGLNFNKADLRQTGLRSITYDPGAFNGSILDDGQRANLTAEFDFYAQDVFDHRNDEILIYCRFRPSTIEMAVEEVNASYKTFADLAEISSNALRKSRRGEVIAHETAVKVLNALSSLFKVLRRPELARVAEAALRQPVVEFVSGGINMPFVDVSRNRYRDLMAMRQEIVEIKAKLNPGITIWRDTPYYIETMLRHYRQSHAGNARSLDNE